MDDTRQRLVRCFAAVFPRLDAGQVEAASADTVAEWDSVAGITLTLLVEEEFGIEIAPQQMPRLNSFAKMLGHLHAVNGG